MSRFLHNDRQGYDSDSDTWFGFETPEAAQEWLKGDDAGIQPVHDYGADDSRVTHTVSVAPAVNAWNTLVTCPSGMTVGPVTKLCEGDEGRLRMLVTVLAAPAGAYVLIGSREGVLAGQGFPLTNGTPIELKNTRPLWVALALGTATAPITATVGILVESTVG